VAGSCLALPFIFWEKCKNTWYCETAKLVMLTARGAISAFSKREVDGIYPGIESYQRYLALGVLGRNLQRLGTIFLDKERKRRQEQMLLMAA
jgi:hypothetical protein